jgi:hypothetical protein
VRRVVVPADGVAEAGLAEGIEVVGAASLSEAATLVRRAAAAVCGASRRAWSWPRT